MIPPPMSSTLFPYTTLFRSPLRRLSVGRLQDQSRGGWRTRQRGKCREQKSRLSMQKQSASTTVKQRVRSEEHTSELQSRQYLVCRLLLEKKKKKTKSCNPTR